MKLIRLSKSCISKNDIRAVSNVLKKEFLGMGKEVMEFEKKLKNFFGRDVVLLNTGTSALQVAIQSCGIGKDDEILVPSITYVASYQAISATGALPISCDVNENDLQISVEDLKKKINKNTKAIMPVHYGGSIANLNTIYKIAKDFKIRVIEDSAHAFGSKYKGKLIGSFGDIACFSFDGIKNITSGEGGCIVTNDKKILNLSRDIRLLGVEKDTSKRYSNNRTWIGDVKRQGWRYHMSNINAALGISQLNQFKRFSKIRIKLCRNYEKLLSNKKRIFLFKRNYKDEVPHIFYIRLVGLKKRSLFKKNLLKLNIETGLHYFPIYKYTKYKSSNLNYPNTEKIYNEIITLPLHPDLKINELKYIVEKVISLSRKNIFFK